MYQQHELLKLLLLTNALKLQISVDGCLLHALLIPAADIAYLLVPLASISA